MSRAARILSTALITAGLVVLLDVGMTLAWQEPVSSLYGWLEQRQADDELKGIEGSNPTAADLRALQGVPIGPKRARILADRFAKRVRDGHAIGRLSAGRLGLSVVVIEGTGTADLEKGPGHYPDTKLPGQGKTIGIAGHRTTYLAPFRSINRLQRGDLILLRMPYAAFTYEVQDHRIVNPSEVGIVRNVGYERLVMTACHPLYSASQRWAVFARLKRIELPPEALRPG
ncbi:MAG: sortase [Solirubrobacterales bacterium]|nr:sortase [Solirubrobacterales bacterium]